MKKSVISKATMLKNNTPIQKNKKDSKSIGKSKGK